MLRPCPVAPRRAAFAVPQQRGALQVMAAAPGAAVDQKKKRTPQPVKRAEQAEERRQANKSRKSACATRIKKVVKVAEGLIKNPASSSEDVAPLEALVSAAYKEIDTAVSKGIFHANTASRKKARVAKYKRQALIAAGLYTPTEEQPGFSFLKRLQATKEAKAAAQARQDAKQAAAANK